MPKDFIQADDGFLRVCVPATSDSGDKEAVLDTYLLGANLADLGTLKKDEDWSNAQYTEKVLELFARFNLPGISAKFAFQLQEQILDHYVGQEKKAEATPVPESAPESPIPMA